MRKHAKVIVATSALLLTLSFGVTFASATAPVVTIDPASEVKYTTAHLSGEVDPQGLFTEWRFQYIADAQFQENLANTLPGFEGAATGPEGSLETVAEPVEGDLSGLSPATVYHLRLLASNQDGTEEAVAGATFETEAVAPPTVSIDPVTTFTGTSAHFTGSIDPEAPLGNPSAFDVNWHFECTPGCPGLTGGEVDAGASGAVEVEDDATGLEPNTSYEVTLIASNAGGQVSAGPEGFKTLGVAPVVQTLYAGDLGLQEATLAANLNPENSPVTYQFEWGLDESYGNLAPASPTPLGAEDNAFHLVTAPVSGLEQGTTYHFRIVATNTDTDETSEGTDHTFTTLEPASPPAPCPNAARRTGPSAKLPDCRAYEMVSPLDKNGGDVEIDGPVRASVSGDAATFMTFANFAGGGVSGGVFNQILSSRESSGWTSRGINPPADPFPSPGQAPPAYQGISPDLSRGVAQAWAFEEAGGAEMFNLYLYDDGPGTYELLSRPFAPIAPDLEFSANTTFAGASADFRHIVFESHRPLTPDAPPGLDGTTNAYLYEWVDGTLRLASILPADEGGEAVMNSVMLGRGRQYISTVYPGENAVSEDGDRIFFSTNALNAGSALPNGLYVRENGATTIRLNTTERTDCAGDPTCGGDGEPDPAPDPSSSEDARFELASVKGDEAFFVSHEKLTDDATATQGGFGTGGGDLYRWREDGPPGERLTDLTTGDPNGGGVSGTVGGASNGSVVYFVAIGDLAPGATAGAANLYVWKAGTGIRLVAALLPSDDAVWSDRRANGPPPHFRDARVSSDGRHIVFRSSTKLTSYDNAGHYQIYMYDAASDGLQCISCNPRTAASTGDAWLKRKNSRTIVPPWLPRNLSADATKVFFDSPEALVPADTNGHFDVYEWSEGDLSLISSGQSNADSAFVDASADGNDAFFTTRQRLLGKDTDGLVDLYDARVDGGFPEQQALPSCLGDACQGQSQPPPVETSAASAAFTGPGNAIHRPKARKCSKGKVKRRGHCVKRKQKHTKNNRAANHRRASR